MSIYHDSSAANRPSLVGDLLGVSATDTNHQFENQATTVLAWLVDWSPAVAAAVLKLFLGDHAPVELGRTGARTQITLPKPGGGALYPDLSVCVDGHAVQVLIEVKIGSDFHHYPEFGGKSQPEVYREVWRTETTGGAAIRAVGTLTLQGGVTEPDPSQLRARDITWRTLRDELQGLADHGTIEPAVALVAESFVSAIDTRIAPSTPTADEQNEFSLHYGPLLDAVKDGLVAAVRGAGTPKTIRGDAYFGWRIPLPGRTDDPLYLRLYLSAKNSRLNLAGNPDSLIAAPERDANGTLQPDEREAVAAAGFARTKDIAGYTLYRSTWPLADLESEQALGSILDQLATTGLLADAAIGA